MTQMASAGEEALVKLAQSNLYVTHLSAGGNKFKPDSDTQINAALDANFVRCICCECVLGSGCVHSYSLCCVVCSLQRRQTRGVLHWMGVCVIASFVRANATSDLRFSILPHIPALSLQSLSPPQLALKVHEDDARCMRNETFWDKWTKTKLALALFR